MQPQAISQICTATPPSTNTSMVARLGHVIILF